MSEGNAETKAWHLLNESMSRTDVRAPRLIHMDDAMHALSLSVQREDALRIELLRMKVQLASRQFRCKEGLPFSLSELRDAVQHVVICADGGDDVNCGRPMIDALTTLGILKKTGRGLWTVNHREASSVIEALSVPSDDCDTAKELRV